MPKPQTQAMPESTAPTTDDSAATDESAAVATDQTDAGNAPEVSAEPIHEPVRHPRPEQSKIDKCVKEWQIGARRANQLVSWLCDPFGDSDLSGTPPAVLATMPTQKSLKQGDEVIGVVVGVMPFGVLCGTGSRLQWIDSRQQSVG